MNQFPKDRLFDLEIMTDDVTVLKPRTRRLYGDWILELKQGKTLFALNINWDQIDPTEFYDTYVFSYHVEQWHNEWLKKFCDAHTDSQIVVISEFPLDKTTDSFYRDTPNLKCLVHHCWDILLEEVLTFDDTVYVPTVTRQHRLSSLVNKPSYFKALVTAHIMINGYHRKDMILSWNINDRQETCPSLGFLDERYSSSTLYPLIKFYHETLKNLSIRLDDFNDTRLSNYYGNIPAYTDCLVNSVNETYAQSYIFPGPFITEKTWKPLMTGCALLPQGPSGIYPYLENFGFVFDYPWDRTHDMVPGDIDRFLQYLKILDQLFEFEFDELVEKLAYSSRYNYDHIRSAAFKSRIQQLNQQYLDEFLRTY